MRRLFAFVSVACLGCMLATAAFENHIKINGKAVPGEYVMVEGKQYVPVSALKAAGATFKTADGTLTIDFPVAGSMQQGGLEGEIGDWLNNGVWRFRVVGISKTSEGWKVDVEIRNATKVNGYAPGGTGWQGITVVLADGTVVGARSDAPELRDNPVNQSATDQQSLLFETDSASEPDRLILRFDPKGIEGTPLKFTTADPTFRVHLKKKSQ